MAQLSIAVVMGEGMDRIKFENERYIYLPYRKVTKENVETFINRNEGGDSFE